jgi:small nuclear ribonucleoprotein G
MNLVIDEAYETVKTGEKRPIGMVVARGNSVSMIEALERLG